MKPVLLGYQVVRTGAPPDAVSAGLRVLMGFARGEGFALGRVFVNRETDHPGSVLAAVIAAARSSSSVTGVVVPTLEDLGRLPRARRLTRQKLEREGGVRVLVAEPGPSPSADAVAATCMNRPSKRPTILSGDVPKTRLLPTFDLESEDPEPEPDMELLKPDPEVEAVDPTRVRVEVVTTSNRAALVEFRVRFDTVETWYQDRLSAVFDRERLRSWLSRPSRWMAAGEVVLSVDPRSGGDRLAIDLPDVLTWTLSPREQVVLVERV